MPADTESLIMASLGIPGVKLIQVGCTETSVQFEVKVTNPFRFLWWGILQQYDVPWWAYPYVFFVVLKATIGMWISQDKKGVV